MVCRAALARAARSSCGLAARRQRVPQQVQQTRCFALAGQKPVDGVAEEWATYPNEREGADYNLNWALNQVKVTPRGDAFGNPRQQLIADRLKTEADKQGVLQLKGLKADGAVPILEAGSEELSFEEYDEVEEAVREHLSQEEVDLFVATGSVGSYRGGRVWMRVISDSPAVCMLAQKLLVPAPDVEFYVLTDPYPPVTLYVTEHSQDFAAVQFQEGASGGALEGATGVLGGTPAKSQAALFAAMSHMASALLLEAEGVIPLPATVLRKGDKTGLLFGASPANVAEAHAAAGLYCAHGSAWYPGVGIGSMWGSVMVPKSSLPADKSEKWSAVVGDVATVTLPTDNLTHPPAALMFLGKGSEGKLTDDQLAEELAKHKLEEDVVTRLKAAVEQGSIEAHRVSSVKAALKQLA